MNLYFQNRKMTVKWNGHFSTMRDLNGGSPQGASLGILEYLSQTTGNVDFISPENRYKFIDDLSTLEVINLISVGITSYNFNLHVASDIAIDQSFVHSSNLQSQKYIDKIQNWTQENKMQLNESKTKVMIFNFTHNYQFTTRISIENTLLDIEKETKLLGTIISDDLSWSKNTRKLVRKYN